MRRHRVATALALLAAATVAVDGYALRGTFIGDAAVYLPYARNASHLHLFQFNLGEFSSGSTSPLWSLLLAIPYVFGLGLTGAKAFSTGFALLGLLATLAAARRFCRSWTATAVAGFFVVGTMTVYAVSLYESGLVVALAALALVAGERIRRGDDGALSARSLAPLVAVWAALPLARPDSVILVIAQAAALIAFGPVAPRRAAPAIAAAVAVAAIPAVVYFGYSQAHLGTFSTSSSGRAATLHEATDRWLGPLYLSDSAIRQLFTSPWLFGVVPAMGGLVACARSPSTRWLAAYGGVAIAGYLALLTFVTPGAYDTPRYLLPIVPILCTGAAVLLDRSRRTRLWPLAAALAFVAIAGSGVLELRDRTRFARAAGIGEYEVFEQDAGDLINRLAAPGDRVLTYEVQARYHLRDDVSVLSEDGITDGKVAPYQSRRDMTGFLERYRPRWWIARDNVLTRDYARGSILERSVRAFETTPGLRARTFDGIRFELVARRGRPQARNFGGWVLLFRLGYGPSPKVG